MNFRRLVAITFIFGCVCVAWLILGSSILFRTEIGYEALGRQVEALWGSRHYQKAPEVSGYLPESGGTPLELTSSQIAVDLQLDHRRKGLLWYATYAVDFDGTYTFQNPTAEMITATVTFAFPTSDAIYDNFEFRIGETLVRPGGGDSRALSRRVEVQPRETVTIHIAYASRGMDEWRYSFADDITTVEDFALVVTTDFDDYDFPERTISPSAKTPTSGGWALTWEFSSLVSDFDIGVRLPQRLNPGPLASKMSYFAPVSLFFFFTVLVVLGAVQGNHLHPMHYFFLGATFFSFHLLFAYLVDHVLLELAFVIAAVVSLALVISYLWRVAGRTFALREAGLSQFFFLILFSYAFFFEGYTGLVITLGSVITLAILMQVTAGVDWDEVFKSKKPAPEKAQVK